MPSRRMAPNAYARRSPIKEPYDVVLIVCEGQKTEPAYFNRLRAVRRLSSANIFITPAGGSDPMSIVQHGEAELAAYDRVFCVFDRDTHANYDQALARIANSVAGQAGQLIGITSTPCFELWILLHFKFHAAPIQSAGTQSACDRVIRELRRFKAGYTKAAKDTYDALEPMLPTAMTNAGRLQADNRKTGSRNPGTNVHELVQYLFNLKP
jgi:hypothetical protein